MYRLTKFGELDLEGGNQIEPAGSGATPINFVDIPSGGAYDYNGSDLMLPGSTERVKTMRLIAASQSALQTAFDELLALSGTRAKLWRTNATGDRRDWQYARLAEVAAIRTYETAQFKRVQDVELRFVTQEASWRSESRGAPWYLDDEEYLDDALPLDRNDVFELTAGVNSVPISLNDGNRPVKDTVITIVAYDPDPEDEPSITEIEIEYRDSHIVYTGAVGRNGLVIDCGAYSVKKGGVDDYDNFDYGENHVTDVWFEIPAAGASISNMTITITGADARITFEHNERWA